MDCIVLAIKISSNLVHGQENATSLKLDFISSGIEFLYVTPTQSSTGSTSKCNAQQSMILT